MKLFYSTNSPYARKCRVVMYEKKLENRIELINVNPLEDSPELWAVNPLGTIPALVTDQGLHVCESPAICEYLDSLSPENPLYPAPEFRICAMAVAALADGIMDAAVACVMEGRRPEEKRYPAWVARKEAAIRRAIAKCAGIEWQLPPPIGGRAGGGRPRNNISISEQASPHPNPPPTGEGISIGTIALGVALAYVSFRLPHIKWRDEHPKLAAWLDEFSKRPSMMRTKPAA